MMSMGATVLTIVTISEGRISPKASESVTLVPHLVRVRVGLGQG